MRRAARPTTTYKQNLLRRRDEEKNRKNLATPLVYAIAEAQTMTIRIKAIIQRFFIVTFNS
jgi:hypothetical protein